jgi:cobalt/nickel transport system ATP-binding protein
MAASSLAVETLGLGFGYPTGRQVLANVDFKLSAGEKVGLIGPNGSGKSTFLHLLMGLLKPTAGELRLFGERVATEADFRRARRKIGLLFQNADDQLFSPTVLEDVAFGPLNLGFSPDDARGMAAKTLADLELFGFEDRITHRLSGGEKKLVSLATVLVMAPEVLLLDEPTTGLDEATNRRIIDILNRLTISYIIVSHEYDFLALTTRTIYSMKDSRIAFNGDATQLHSHYHVHPAGSLPHAHSENSKGEV